MTHCLIVIVTEPYVSLYDIFRIPCYAR